MNSASIRQSLARLALRRQPIHTSRRFSSSDAQQEKAQDTLATAQKVSGKVFENVKKFLGPVGEFTGRLFGCMFIFPVVFILYIDVLLTHFFPFFPGRGTVAYKQPLLYNLAVTREIIKQIYIRECLQPPSLSTIRSVYSSLWSQINTPGLMRTLFKNGEVGRLGVYGLQAYGIFKVRFVFLFFVAFNKSSLFEISDWRNIRASKSGWLRPALDYCS
jgi:F-type H+-transporting ATPase subunit g